MTALTHKTDHAAEAYLRLSAPFWGAPRTACLLITEIEQIQALEDAIWSVIDQLDVDTAQRWMLKCLASLVGEADRPSDDNALRTLIRGRIRANLSSGTLPELLDLARLLGLQIGVLLDYRLMVQLLATPPTADVDMAYAARLLDDAAAGGVRTELLTAGTFALPDMTDPDPPITGAMGVGTWSDYHAPA